MDGNINNVNNGIDDSMSKDRRGIFFAIVGIMTIIVAIAGATYAYFAASATNNNIAGESGYTASPLTLTVTMSSTGTGKLVPQLTNAIDTAANTTNKCVDANGNTVCKVYTVTIKNNTTTKIQVRGTLTLTAASIPNLNGAYSTSNTSGFQANATKVAGTSSYSLTKDLGNYTLANGASQVLYIAVWIAETNSAQTDSGTFAGTVTFNGYASGQTSGISSTIRG